MIPALDIIRTGFTAHPRAAIAVSGGNDSLVVLDLIYRWTDYRPPVVFVDTQMEYPETYDFIKASAERYGAEFHAARADRYPEEQWQRQGWPMLGKVAGQMWNRTHRGYGFKCGNAACCRRLKIGPGRDLCQALGATLQFTGLLGSTEGLHRGMRARLDGAIHFVKEDRMWTAAPLLGWTHAMVQRYLRRYEIPTHPAKERGAKNIGCVWCGGGSQFWNSNYRLLRTVWPEAWREFVVSLEGGLVILALKYSQPLPAIRAAVDRLGGLALLADTRPWLFYHTRRIPITGYEK